MDEGKREATRPRRDASSGGDRKRVSYSPEKPGKRRKAPAE